MAKKNQKLAQLNVGLELEKKLKKDIFDFLQYDKVKVVMDGVEYGKDWIHGEKNDLIRQGLLVSDNLLKPLYDLLQKAQKRLGFKEKINLYVVSRRDQNACALYSFDPEEPHIIEVFSGLINTLSDEELLSIIGHEVGHLMYCDAEINRLMSFIYGDTPKETSRFLESKLSILSQLYELRCDRCGYIASGKLEPSVTAEFALICGINFARFGGDAKAVIDRSKENINMIKEKDMKTPYASHPDSPLRIRAIEIFAKNDDDAKIKKEMAEIISIINDWTVEKRDRYYADFMVTAGLLVANIDGKITTEETDAILRNVEHHTMFPMKSFKRISKKEIEPTFKKAVKAILKDEPGQAIWMTKYMLRVMMADQKMDEDEINYIYQMAIDTFGITKDQFSTCYAEIIKDFFDPRYNI